MPAIGFICPDHNIIKFEDCFKECRLREDLPMGRCKAVPYLRKISKQREWTGEPSTTQLLQGTREAFYKITKPFYIDPEKRIFVFHGTNVHWILDKFGQGDNFNEERLRDDICSGAFDFYDGADQVLYDYKTWGSYKVQQCLGIRKRDGVPLLDEAGRPILYKSGKNKGRPRTQTVYVKDDIATRALALLETSIQISNYRDKLLQILPEGYTVKKLAVQVISRDAGLKIQKLRHVQLNAPVIPINGVSKVWVDRYLKRKRDMLLEAIEKGEAPVCRKRERWMDRKCNGFCDVNIHCDHWLNNIYKFQHYDSLEDEEND